MVLYWIHYGNIDVIYARMVELENYFLNALILIFHSNNLEFSIDFKQISYYLKHDSWWIYS